MTRSSVALSIIFTISVIGVNCQNNVNIYPMDKQYCLGKNDVCSEDRDCCTQYCAKQSFWFDGKCSDPISLVKTKRFSNEVQYGDCYFNNLTITEESNQLFEEFGVSAAHKSLEPHSQVMLLYGNESIIVNINSRIPSDNSTILEISNIAARVLGIRNGGKFKCRVLFEEKSFLYSFISHYPVILIIGGVLGSFQLLGYMF